MSANYKKLDNRHWTDPLFCERMPTKQWRSILLSRGDQIIFKGILYKLIANPIGYGVVEVSKGIEASK